MVIFKDMEERIAYVEALVFIASVDNKVEDIEKEQVNQIARLYEVPEDRMIEIWNDIQQSKDLASIVSKIQSRGTKLMLLYELIVVCYADQQYGEEERKGTREICSLLGIEIDKLMELEELVLDNQKLAMRLRNALEMEGE